MKPAADVATSGRRSGRRKGDSRSREAILAAAREAFAEQGYAASLRPIAERAGVDVGLIRYFFGTKEELFVASLQLPEKAPERMMATFTGDPDELGARIVRAYLSLWTDPETAHAIQAVVRTALTSPSATDRLRELIEERLMRHALPEWAVGDVDVEARFAVLSAQLMGVAIARYVLGIGPISRLNEDELVALLAPTVQAGVA